MSAFSIALSGLTAASTDLDVMSNNVANADTIGFKSSRAEFADVYAAGAVNLNQSSVGEGVRVDCDRAAIHAGRHHHDRLEPGSGHQRRWLLHAAGSRAARSIRATANSPRTRTAMWSPPPGRRCRSIRRPPTAASTPARPPTLICRRRRARRWQPAAGTVILNLPAGLDCRRRLPFDPTNPATYNQSTSTTVYDSLGNAQTATFYFTQTAVPNQWNVNMTVNGTAGRRGADPDVFQHGRGDRAGGRRPGIQRLHADRRRGGHEHELQFRPERRSTAAVSA